MILNDKSKTIRVYITDISGLGVDDIPVETLDNRVIDRFMQLKGVPEKAVQTAVAHLLSRYIVRDYGNAQIVKDDFGKPFYANLPLFLSVSHSDNLVVSSLYFQNHGVDVELIRSVPERTARGVLSKEEYERFDAAVEPQKSELFARFFTQKESFVKKDGKGFTVKPRDVVFPSATFFCTEYLEKGGKRYCLTACTDAAATIEIISVSNGEIIDYFKK